MIATAVRTAALVVLAAVLVAGVDSVAPQFSSASFTAQTKNGANSVGAAVDWTPPAVSLQNLGTTVQSTVSVTATASDAETGVRNVVLAFQPAGATTWTTLCTTTTAPYTCSWDTRTVADGAYDLRAVATDNAGYSTTSASVRTTVSNTITVTLADPGDFVRATVSLVTTLQNAGTAPYSVRMEYAAAGTSTWKAICTTTVAPYTCAWNTTATGNASVANADYDLRAVATLNGVSTVSASVLDVLVDNLAPTVTMVDPGSPLRGTVTLTANAADEHSGLARVVIQYAPNGTTAWTDACTLTTLPYSCRFTTTAIADGSYAFRAVATDLAGNPATASATIGARIVDNSVASVAMEDPGAYLSGTATLAATANSTAGVKTVAIQFAPAGTTSWTTVCSATGTPYGCAWNTTAVADGLYDLRAILTDNTGKQTTSATLAGRNVDNRPVRGVDVQTQNGGATAGRLEAGDTMTFTYSRQMNPASISSGWNGAALPVTVRLQDGILLGLGGAGDTVDIQRSGAAVNLGSVNLKGDYVRNRKTSTFSATMTATTVTVNGLPVTVVQVVVGSLVQGGALRTASAASGAAMVWTPSASATDLSGGASSVAPVTESGALDVEF
jgi:hypothetical protein